MSRAKAPALVCTCGHGEAAHHVWQPDMAHTMCGEPQCPCDRYRPNVWQAPKAKAKEVRPVSAAACFCGHPYARHAQVTPAECLVRHCKCGNYRPAPSEAAFQATVTELLRKHGWKVFSVRKSSVISATSGRRVSMVTDNGWPDIVAVTTTPNAFRPSIVSWECKAVNGKTTPEQDEWLAAWKHTGADARVIRPGDWDELKAWVEGV